MTTSTRDRAVSSIAAKIVVTKVLQVRKHNAGTLLKAVRSISKIDLRDRADFGDGLHCAHSEPYFYESAYLFEERTGLSSAGVSACACALLQDILSEMIIIIEMWCCSKYYDITMNWCSVISFISIED